jgi:hypothetical protein
MGNKNLLGFHHSDETKRKISRALMGNTYTLGYCPSAENRAKSSIAHWKGGRKVASRREEAKRRGLGYVFLNEPFSGCEGHHVDNEQVINMPKKLHRSIYHRQTDGRGMAKINATAYNFLFKQEVTAAITARGRQ